MTELKVPDDLRNVARCPLRSPTSQLIGSPFMKFGHFFVDRPIFAAVVSIVTWWSASSPMSACRSRSFRRSPRRRSMSAPPIPAPTPQTIAETVATPLEQAINGVEGMIYQTSQATNDGSLPITVTFATGTNLDIAQVQVQNRVAAAEPRLPAEVRALGITVNKAASDFLLIVNAVFAGRLAERIRHLGLCHRQRSTTSSPRRRRRPTSSSSACASRRCASGSIRTASPAST